MDIDNWINLIAAIIVGGGTLFLGIMAWRTIRQTRRIQRAEKRERLLNEIIEWAKRAARCGYEERVEFPIVFSEDSKSKMDLEVLDMVETTARVLSIEGSYISNIAIVFSDSSKNLNLKVADVVSKLDIVWRQALKYMRAYHKEHKLPGEKEIKELRESAQDLIEEATKIKTRGIS